MPILQEKFGITDDGEEVIRYTLTNGNNLEVRIINYGGIITNIFAPDKNGTRADIVLGFDSFDGYKVKHPYFGALIGRYGNRIAGGKFSIDGTEYSLATNNNGNALHGGLKGFDKRVWTASVEGDKLVLQLDSPDGEEGYPGNLTCYVTYQLTPDNRLTITYFALTDKPTIVNMTNHSYFNLNGHDSGTIDDHVLRVKASHFTPVNETLIPTGKIEPVDGTAMDLQMDTLLGNRINQVPGNIGFDHNFCLEKPGQMKHVARLYHPDSGRCMNMYSSEPGVQVYTGAHMPDITGKGGVKYKKFASLCLEAQHYPNSPNQENYPPVVLRPGGTYTQSTSYEFSVVK